MSTTHDDIDTLGGPELKRREFLKGTGGLVIAFGLFGALPAAVAGGEAGNGYVAPLDNTIAPPDPARLYAWLAVHADNTATLFTGKIDMGNGTLTALAQIAAEELDISFDRLNVVMGTTSTTVDQGPSYGSKTIRYAGPQVRHAAAAGRQAMLTLGSKHLQLPAAQLGAVDGVVSVVGNPDKSVTYGELVNGRRLNMEIGASGETFGMEVAPDAPIKDPSTYTVVGQSLPRKDIPGKVTGEFTYMQDVKVSGMLHGRVVRPYGMGAKLLEVDETGLDDIPGFVQIVRRNNFLGVVAKTEWAAIQAAAKLGSVLHPAGPDAGQATWSDWQGLPDMDGLWQAVREAPGQNYSVVSEGSVDLARNDAAKTIKATYRTPFQMHASIGPGCAIADVRADSATFWSCTQMPHQARRDMAELLAMPIDNMEVRWVEGAGQYGRNGHEHVVADAALMSQAVGKPVRVQWMRWDANGWEPKEPAIVQDMLGAIDDKGKVIAWQHHLWMPTFADTHLVAGQLIGQPVGATGAGTPGGVSPYAYTFPNADVALRGEGRVGLLTAWLRSPGMMETTLGQDSFIDELAAATNEDPLTFRLRNLGDERAIDVLRAAAEAYGWQSRPAHSREQDGDELEGRGIAWVNRDESYVATIAEVTVNRKTGEIRARHFVVAHDCGLVVSPDGLRNQIEGNILQSLSRTLHEEVAFDNAHVTSRDWSDYPILRFHEVPDNIDMVLVNNRPEYPSHGAGEPSTNPTAAVISNAVFDATGVRLRQTPFRPDRVKAAVG